MKTVPQRPRHKGSGRVLALAGIGALGAGAISLAIWLFGKLLALMWISILSTAIVAMTGCGSGGDNQASPTSSPKTPAPISTLASGGASSSGGSSASTIFPDAVFASEAVTRPSAYDGKTVTLTGQTLFEGKSPEVMVDGTSGVNIAGKTETIQRGFYRLTGTYEADTNTLRVTDSVQEPVTYVGMDAASRTDMGLVPVSLEGLIATPPKEIADTLDAYLSVPFLPGNLPVYPYVVYSKTGFYLVLSDALVDLPGRFTFHYQDKDYGFTFSSGEVKGTLVKTPLQEIDFGSQWQPAEFGGVVIASVMAHSDPTPATVKEITGDPAAYAFKRVSVHGSYIVTTATVDYSNIKAPMGQGILADQFADFFKEDAKLRLETIDPDRRVWQLKQAQVMGTVIYPTDDILKYLDYAAPLSVEEVQAQMKPALIIDTMVEQVEKISGVSELDPVAGNPARYWDKVVEFDGYAVGVNYPLKKAAEAIARTEVPVNVNLLAVGIADKPALGSQVAIIGLNNDLVDENGETIAGRFRFRVAVSHVPEGLLSGIPYTDTALFLISKEELPLETLTPNLHILTIAVDPPGTGSVIPNGGQFLEGTSMTLTAVAAPGYVFDHWSGDASGTSPTITLTMDADESVTAHFKPQTAVSYSLVVSVDPEGGGIVTVSPPGNTYPSGTAISLTAVPSPGYLFDRWDGDISGTSDTVTVTMDRDMSVTARFRRVSSWP